MAWISACCADRSGSVRVSMSLAVTNANPASRALALSEMPMLPVMVHAWYATVQTCCTSIHVTGVRKASDAGPAFAGSADVEYEKLSSMVDIIAVSSVAAPQSSSVPPVFNGLLIAVSVPTPTKFALVSTPTPPGDATGLGTGASLRTLPPFATISVSALDVSSWLSCFSVLYVVVRSVFSYPEKLKPPGGSWSTRRGLLSGRDTRSASLTNRSPVTTTAA